MHGDLCKHLGIDSSTDHPGLWSTGNMRKYHQIDIYIYQCDIGKAKYIHCGTVNALKSRQTLLFHVFQENVGYQGRNSQNACQDCKKGRPWSDCLFRSSLIWVCICLLGWQLVLKILELLLYLVQTISIKLAIHVLTNALAHLSLHYLQMGYMLCPGHTFPDHLTGSTTD